MGRVFSSLDDEEFNRLFLDFRHTSYRLETLQRYDVPYERDEYHQFLAGLAQDTSEIMEWVDGTISRAVRAGKRMQRVHVVEEPLSDYLRWEHACTEVNITAGEDIRWLPRTKAADLMLPGADCFVFDHRVVRWNFQRGDGTNPRHYTFSSDPRTIRDIVAAFELAWNRATPHADYKPD